MDKSLEKEISEAILHVVPRVMRALRTEIRTAAKADLTVPQLRVLAHLHNGIEDATSLAEILGVSLPAVSKMIALLEGRALIKRGPSKVDRRQAVLGLTPKGRQFFLKARSTAQLNISKKIALLNRQQQETICHGLLVLGRVFPESKN